VKQQFKQLDEKKAELQQRFDEVSEVIRKSECELETLQHRQQGLTTDMAARPTLNRELQEIETLLSEIERRKTLVESIAETQRQIRRLEEGSGESSILRTATSYLRRISADDLQRIEVSHGKHVWVSDAKGNRLSWSHLTDGARDMVYLTLCLALVEAQDQRKTPLPSIWKDLFTNFDSRHVPETAALLCEFAHEGRQILLLTRHEHVASVFEFMDVPSHRLVATQDGPTSHSPHHDQLPTRDLSLLRSAPGETTVTDVDSATTPNEDREVDSNFFLFAESPIERSPALSADDAVRLRRLGLTTVGELLQVSGDDIAAELSYAEVSSRMVADWQSQALMMCHVAHLREYDARILVACGITDPSHLNQISPVEVRAMIERFAASGEGRATLLSGTEFELSRVTDWVRIAASPDRQQQQPTGNNTNRQDGRQADVVRMNPTLETHDLQYYLEDSSNVVDAPSIGQRSAERLETVGIVTVSDLLAADPIELAGRLKNGRMKTKLIVTWQQQSTLVCRVPKLRGHDAQILVAIGVTDAEELAAMEPQELWSKVEPFAESTAGKRIIRSSKTPDFEEVFHWIEWASLARTLNAA
jgi:predicted flap endonuclease-1-like 5' DNA nuclease